MPQVAMEQPAPKHNTRLKTVAVGLVVAVLVVGGASAAWLYYHKPAPAKQTATTTPGHYIGNIYVPPITEDSAAIEEMKQAEYSEKLPQLLAAAKSGDSAKRADAYRELAFLALNADKPDEALKYAKSGEEVAKSHLSAATVARVAEETGDYKLAVQYYNLAMSRAQASSETKVSALYDGYKVMRDAVAAK